MTAISWTTLLPSNTSRVGIGPKDIRSVWTSINEGLNHSLCPIYWSAESRGEERPGAFRTYYGATSVSSNGGGQDKIGRPMFSSDESILRLYTSTKSQILGSHNLIEHESLAGDNNAWVSINSYIAHSGTAEVTTTFPVVFTEAPIVILTSLHTDNPPQVASVTSISFKSKSSNLVAVGAKTIYYRAIGKLSQETL